jgi:hypothetical protein
MHRTPTPSPPADGGPEVFVFQQVSPFFAAKFFFLKELKAKLVLLKDLLLLLRTGCGANWRVWALNYSFQDT